MNNLFEKYPELLNVTDVAGILGVSPNTVRKLIKENTLHAVKVGKRYRITKNKLLAYLGEIELSTYKEDIP